MYRSRQTQRGSFNTQPPEGGCLAFRPSAKDRRCFNTQPPEGGCHALPSRRAALGSFNTQPPEGGWDGGGGENYELPVSTHSRLKAAEPLSKALLHQASQPRFR